MKFVPKSIKKTDIYKNDDESICEKHPYNLKDRCCKKA